MPGAAACAQVASRFCWSRSQTCEIVREVYAGLNTKLSVVLRIRMRDSQNVKRASTQSAYLLDWKDANPAGPGCARGVSDHGADKSTRLAAASWTASPSSGPEPRPSSVLPAALAAALVIAARLPCPSASPYTCLSLRGSSGTIVSCLKGEETGRLHPTPSSLASEAREASSLSRTGCPPAF